MKNIIEKVAIIGLICFSFFYTDKVINIINKKDPLMTQIINKKNNYDVIPVSAILTKDTIIPGVNGREVDINKSYKNMKLGGIFREEALIFKDLYPTSSLKDNKDKYIISGNKIKKNIVLITILNNKKIKNTGIL